VEFIPTELPGVILIRPTVFSDQRGYFFESFKAPEFEEAGLPVQFVQDNQAFSVRNVLRGLHYQRQFPQGKLVSVPRGAVRDIAVDIRKGSDTFGKWVAVELSEENHKMLYIPPGFAHGYCVLSETALFQYKCTDIYHPEDEYGIRWDDPDLRIDWGIDTPIISEKDLVQPLLHDIPDTHLPEGIFHV